MAREPVRLEQTSQCPECESLIDVVFTIEDDSVWERQDIVEPPTVEVTCGECEHTWTETYEGWSNYEDA